MGLVRGRWLFEKSSELPCSSRVATELAKATGLRVFCRNSESEIDEQIDIPAIKESLFDIDRCNSALTLCSYIPAHPYLWENLDRVLMLLGGRIEKGKTYWQPDPKHQHLRQAWQVLTLRQRFLLRLPTLGVWRFLDRFV